VPAPSPNAGDTSVLYDVTGMLRISMNMQCVKDYLYSQGIDFIEFGIMDDMIIISCDISLEDFADGIQFRESFVQCIDRTGM